jgi:hypothetical protein
VSQCWLLPQNSSVRHFAFAGGTAAVVLFLRFPTVTVALRKGVGNRSRLPRAAWRPWPQSRQRPSRLSVSQAATGQWARPSPAVRQQRRGRCSKDASQSTAHQARAPPLPLSILCPVHARCCGLAVCFELVACADTLFANRRTAQRRAVGERRARGRRGAARKDEGNGTTIARQVGHRTRVRRPGQRRRTRGCTDRQTQADRTRGHWADESSKDRAKQSRRRTCSGGDVRRRWEDSLRLLYACSFGSGSATLLLSPRPLCLSFFQRRGASFTADNPSTATQTCLTRHLQPALRVALQCLPLLRPRQPLHPRLLLLPLLPLQRQGRLPAAKATRAVAAMSTPIASK